MSGTKNKRYLAVLLVSASVFLVDRFVLSSDLPEPSIPVQHDGPSSNTLIPEPELAIPELPFPPGIKPIDPNAEVRDLFAPPSLDREGRLGGSDADKFGDAGQRLSAPGRQSSAAFKSAHRLNGVLVDQRLKIAGVDGQWMRIGTSIDGCTLTDISPRKAVFQCFDNKVILTLDDVAVGSEHLK